MATILELAAFSDYVYGDGNAPIDWGQWTQLSPTLTPAMTAQFANDGYLGEAFINDSTGEIVIANRGTDITNFSHATNLLNLWSDVQLTFHVATQVQKDAADFAKQVAKDNPGVAIIETGHSLGGSEAQAATVALADYGKLIPGFSVSAVTFNSPGIGGYAATNAASSYNVLNLYDQGDAIHAAGGDHL